MRRTLLILGLVLAAALGLLWATGGMAVLESRAVTAQREVQGAMAGAIRALKAGRPGALAALLAVSFGYGFFHAVGPGHGKMLIGGYGVGSRVRLAPLAAIAVLSSLAQATSAVLLVYAGVFLFGWTRERMVGVSEQVLDPLGYAAIAAIGVWLVYRGGRALAGHPAQAADEPHRHQGSGHDHGHSHAHHHDHASPPHGAPGHVHDASCGHRHGPTLDEVAQVTGWRDALALIGGIALRPCTGALFVLILTWQMGIGAMGILAAYAMGLGTAAVTLAVAAMAVWAREGAFAALPGRGLARALPLMQIATGLVVSGIAADLMIRSI